MSGRTTAILFVVLLVVAGAAYLVSRQEPAAEETPTAAFATPVTAALISGITAESVSHLEIRNLQAEDAAVFSHVAGDWFQTTPTQTQVISFTVDSYMQGLINLTSRRTLPTTSGEAAAYGLDTPAYEIVLSAQEGEQAVRFTLLVGNTTTADDGYYVQKQGDPRVHIVNKSVLDNVINLLETLPIPLPTPELTPFMSIITDTLTLTGTATMTATVPATSTLASPTATPSN